MALILNIETSTEVCSTALAQDGLVTHLRENLTGQNHAMLLTIFIKELLAEAGLSVDQLDAVAVSGGPGSYTGLRIGVSVAKGICYSAHLPLIAITSLEAMAHHIIQNLENVYPIRTKDILFCPMIDARRMEVYTSFYDKNVAFCARSMSLVEMAPPSPKHPRFFVGKKEWMLISPIVPVIRLFPLKKV